MPPNIGNQYEIIRISKEGFERWTRVFDVDQKRWIGDNRSSPNGDTWHTSKKVSFADVDSTFSDRETATTEPSLTETPIVAISNPADSREINRNLEKLPRLRLIVEGHHEVVRVDEQSALNGLLKEKRYAWLVADWGLGKEGFLAAALKETQPNQNAVEIYRLQCGGVKSCDELLADAETQLGMSFQEFFAEVAHQTNAVLVFDDLPPAIVTGTERGAFERRMRSILDFCPVLRVILVARQEPRDTDRTEIVTLRPLDIPATRRYLREHRLAQYGVSDQDDLERVHEWSGGLPMHLDRYLERRQHMDISDILAEDTSFAIESSAEPLPLALQATVARLADSEDKQLRQSCRLLKVLTVLKDGETFKSIRRFYREPFYQGNVDDLVQSSLLEDVAISQTAADLKAGELVQNRCNSVSRLQALSELGAALTGP